MKGTQYLSQFQKDQYASYLETQLEKFSTFMLAQRKENEKYRHLQDMITQQHSSISHIKQQIELIEVYHHQNLQNCQHINKKLAKYEGLQQQLQRIQDRCRLVIGQEAKFTSFGNECSDRSGKLELIKEIDMRVSRMEKSQSDLNKKMKTIEEEIDRNKDLIHGICKSRSFLQNQETQSFASHKDLKKLQKKMHKYFDQKFSQIEQIMKKTQRKRSKSPSFRTPIEFVNSYSSAQQTQKLLSQFKINDTSNMKSEVSTLSRQTKRTPVESRTSGQVFKKEKKRQKGKSQSRSKSKSKKCMERSKSKSKKDVSAKKSDISRSKSPKLSKKHHKQQSVQKSRKSSLSCQKSQRVKPLSGIPRKKSKKCPESCGTRCG